MGRTRTTVYDVAERAGVSIATVSRVLRRHELVAPATADRVLTAVRELGYVPSGSARGLATRRSGAIGVCFPGYDVVEEGTPEPTPDGMVSVRFDPPSEDQPTSDLYIGDVLHGLETEAWRHQMTVTVAISRGERPEERLADLAGRVDGLIVLSGTFAEPVLERVATAIPVVVLAGRRGSDSHDHLSTANTAGAQALVSHLLHAHDPHEIGFVGGPAGVADDIERFAGYQAAVAAAGRAAPTAPLVRGDFTQVGGREVGRRLLARGLLPDALVCANDQTALGLLDVLTGAELSVPDDVIVTGYDGIEATRWSRPRLTTVHQPMVSLGRTAVELLLRRLQDPSAPPQERVLPVEVLLRESCGCAPPPS